MVCAKDRQELDDVNLFVSKAIGRMRQSCPDIFLTIIKNHRLMVIKRYRSDFDFILGERMREQGLVLNE